MIKKIVPHPDKTIFTPAEACGYLGLSWNSIKKLIDEGEIGVKRVGRRYLIPKQSLDQYIYENEIKDRILIRSILS